MKYKRHHTVIRDHVPPQGLPSLLKPRDTKEGTVPGQDGPGENVKSTERIQSNQGSCWLARNSDLVKQKQQQRCPLEALPQQDMAYGSQFQVQSC